MKRITLVKIFTSFALILFVFSLWNRMPNVDDAWIGEHAYWMEQNGFVKSDLMHGITGQEIRHIVHHKLFTLNGALLIHFFGFSLFTLQCASLIWLILFLLVFIGYVFKTMGKQAAWVAASVLLVNAFIFQYSFVYRPEIMVMTLGFLSYFFLNKYLERSTLYAIVLSGFIAGFAGATHLNGLIFIAAGALMLLWNKKYTAALIFALACIPSFSIYFYDFTQQYDLRYWLYQLNDSPALYKSMIYPSFTDLLAKLSNIHLRFFHSPKEISLTLLFVFLLIVNFRTLIKEDKFLLKYLVILVILLSLLSVHTTSKYLLLFLPYMMLIIIKSIVFIYTQRKSGTDLLNGINIHIGYRWTAILTGGYILINSFTNLEIATEKFDPESNYELVSKYMGDHTDTLNILAPMTFIFNEMGNFNRIQSDLSIVEMQKTGKLLTQQEIFEYADSLNLEYLIIADEQKKNLGLQIFHAPTFYKQLYIPLGIEQGLSIFKRARG